jgi:hypothetical protein
MLVAFGAFAQSTHNIDFEPAGTGADWSWTMTENADNPPLEFVANPAIAGINTSATTAKFIARTGGNPWALCFTDGDGVFTFDATNSIVKIMVYKPTISDIGLKFEGFSGDFQILVPNTLINQWEEITFNFSAKIGSTYSRIVIIPDFTFAGRPVDNIIYFDNIQVPDGFTVPTLAEPTTVPPVPVQLAENVLSVYSEAYTNIPGTNFNPGWGQSTTVTVNYNAAGNNTLKYANLNYQGTQYTNQNVSGYEYLHVDFWTPNSTNLSFYLISPGNEKPYSLSITAETWVSVDIPLSHYVPPVNLADVFQFKVVGNGTVYFDNLYFWKNPAGAGTDASLSDLLVDGVTVPGFLPGVLSYSVELPSGTVTVPVVTATTTDPEAGYVVNDAAALPGTTEVVVTAADGTTIKTYSIEFTVAGIAPGSDYCATEVFHFGIAAEVQSAAYLTIKNIDALSMIVEIESATADPVDVLIVTGGSGAAISDENTSVPGKISRVLSWVSNPPADVTLNILWSKATFPGNWMLIEGEFTVPFEAGCEPAGPAPVTFRVDMSEFGGAFTNVYVSGSFNGWSGNANQLLDPETDGVYEAELLLDNGSYEYKFTLDGWAVQEEFLGGEPCVITVGGYHNRELNITGATVLPLVCWNSCFVCGYAPPSYDVTFQVNMSQYAGAFTNVYLSGSMNSWCGNCNQLTDANLDGIYDLTINLAEGNYEYKFTLDNWAGQEEFAGGEPCTINLNGYNNRYISVGSATTTPAFCWNSCEPCIVLPVYYDVTFQVDMSQYSGTYNEVNLNGSFNNWCGSCNPLTDVNADNVYETTLSLVEGTTYQYKFTLDGWNIQEEFVGGESCTSTIGGFTNRTLFVDQTITLLDVCWNSCDVCPTIYPRGWSGISSNLIPEGKMSMDEVFAPVLNHLVVMLGKDGIYWPGANINTLGEWDTYQGYKIKFDKGVDFTFTGSEPTNRTVTLNPGIFYVPVLSVEPVSVEELIVPLGNAIEFMFNITSGEVYWPAGGLVPGVNGALETLVPGYAYLTRINSTVVIDFGGSPKNSGFNGLSIYESPSVPAWNEVSPTGTQHIISLATTTLTSGDVVGAFNAEGICVGKAAFNGTENMIPLIVFGDDETTDNKDGMASGEEMTFRIYRAGQVIAVTAVYDNSVANYDGIYTENGLSIIRELKAGTTGIISQQKATFSIFPNPGNGQIFISLAKDGIYNVSVSSSQGQQVFSTTISGSQNLDLSALSKGVYFIRVSDASSIAVEKMVIR